MWDSVCARRLRETPRVREPVSVRGGQGEAEETGRQCQSADEEFTKENYIGSVSGAVARETGHPPASWQQLKDGREQGSMDGGLAWDSPDEGKRLHAGPGQAGSLFWGPARLGHRGRWTRQSLRGLTGSTLCSGPDLAQESSAVTS